MLENQDCYCKFCKGDQIKYNLKFWTITGFYHAGDLSVGIWIKNNDTGCVNSIPYWSAVKLPIIKNSYYIPERR